MRSTTAPRIRQQVIAAKVAWKPTYTSSYSTVFLEKVPTVEKVPVRGSNVPARNTRDNPPKMRLPGVKASE